MALERLSAGIYRDPTTGKTVRSKNGTAPVAATNARKVQNPSTNVPNAQWSDPNSVIDTGLKAGQQGGAINNQLTNGNYNSWGGSQKTTVDPNTGQTTTNYGLSQPNQSILSNQQQAGQHSYDLLNGFLGGNGDDPNNPLSRLQQSTYNRLSGKGTVDGLDQSYQQNKEQTSQSLANRGIPVGSDLYNREMSRLDQNYNTAKQNTQDSAYQQSFNQLGQLNTMGQAGFIDTKTGQTAATTGNASQPPSAADIYGTFQGGQNVSGTNAANKTIGAGHDAASVASAAVAGKYALLGKLTDAGNPTFGAGGTGGVPPSYYPSS